ncbi:MAG: replicative DNA helicase [Treponema sp.]|nr:MAG: replicative DNA helicase [Treponema sp.]
MPEPNKFSSNLNDNIPPHNLEAEKAVLGALLLDQNAMAKISFLKVQSFYAPQHKKIFEVISELYNEGKTAPDILVLTEKLKSKKELDLAGGAAYIASLPGVVPTTANIEYYASIVLDMAIRRNLLHVSAKIHADSFDASIPGKEIIENAQQKIFELTEAGQKATYQTPKNLMVSLIEKIEERNRNPSEIMGTPSGFNDLDYLTSGFQDSDLIIIGARPGMGKTAVALSMFSYITQKKKTPAAFFSLEMSDIQILTRLLALDANVSMNNLRSGHISAAELQRLSDSAGRIYETPAYLVDMPNMGILDLKTLSRQLCKQEGVKIIFVDYLGLITAENRALQPFDQMAEISKSLKSLARELNVPIVALSQLNREAEGKTPGLANIRGSGAIEQDADIVMFIHRERQTSDSAKSSDREGIETELRISKHRNGPTGTVNLIFLPKFAKYVEKAKKEN